jgi:hypothetical protein
MASNLLLRLAYSFVLFCSTAEVVYAKSKIYTQFNNCEKKTAGVFALKAYKKFEENHSLYDVKKWVDVERQHHRHFIEEYKAKYDPLAQKLVLDLVCPKALVKVYNSKGNQDDSSTDGILSQAGVLYDPTFELTLSKEGKDDIFIPALTIMSDRFDDELLKNFLNFATNVQKQVDISISEYILQSNDELLLILSTNAGPTSVFLGDNDWPEKSKKLIKIHNYFNAQKSFPRVINLQNTKKVVVKY